MAWRRIPDGSEGFASELSKTAILYRIPDPLELKGSSGAEGLAVDAKGNVYGAEVGPRRITKHVRQ